mmetsp:Transcript_12284/g.37864  ORF Transcript_12284/g.37864 Transcript_12284/m.37864 type:complete len:102 (-) Transcript_12284:334-639(-)
MDAARLDMALLKACLTNRVDDARAWIERGADVNHVYHDTTPLIAACRRGSIDMATLLLERGQHRRRPNRRTFSAIRSLQARPRKRGDAPPGSRRHRRQVGR